MEIPYTVETRPDTGLANGKLGIWLFLASEVMLFGALFSTYIILRDRIRRVAARRAERLARHGQHVHPHRIVGDDGDGVGVAEAARLRQASAVSARHVRAGRRLSRQQVLRVRQTTSTRGEVPSHSTFLAIYFTLTGLHGLHIIGGMVVMAYLLGPGAKMYKTHPDQFIEPHRVHRSVLALRRPGVDLPVPGFVFVVDMTGSG